MTKSKVPVLILAPNKALAEWAVAESELKFDRKPTFVHTAEALYGMERFTMIEIVSNRPFVELEHNWHRKDEYDRLLHLARARFGLSAGNSWIQIFAP